MACCITYPGVGVYGEATYYNDYGAIGFGSSFFKYPDSSTVTHEFSHAFFAPAEVFIGQLT